MYAQPLPISAPSALPTLSLDRKVRTLLTLTGSNIFHNGIFACFERPWMLLLQVQDPEYYRLGQNRQIPNFRSLVKKKDTSSYRKIPQEVPYSLLASPVFFVHISPPPFH